MSKIPLTPAQEALARRPPPPVAWSGVRKVHIMGICGSAMGAFAGMLRARGLEVRGSDRGAYPPMSTTLAAAGVTVMEGYRPENLDWGPDVVIVGNVIHPGYPEAVALRERGVPHCSLPQALAGLFIEGAHSVVVTGTHGKTTTSAMTAWLLHDAGLDPGFMIGGIAGGFDTNHRLGGGDVFVVEGDEYDTAYFDKGPKFLHYRPRSASVNNIEFDHADIYEDVEAIEDAFTRFVRQLPSGGRLVVNARDDRAIRVAGACAAPVWTFGLEGVCDLRAADVRPHEGGTDFTLHLPGHRPMSATLPLWGHHNLENALTAAGLALSVGAPPEAIVRGLASFRLPRKRQELRGVVADIPVIDDFAHHPTAIAKTIASVRDRYPGRAIHALFEVESNTSRRRVFQAGFADALSRADSVTFCEPLAKDDGLPPEERLDMGELMAAIEARGVNARLISDVDALAQGVADAMMPGRDVVLAMSGRDFHGVHRKILAALSDRLGGEVAGAP